MRSLLSRSSHLSLPNFQALETFSPNHVVPLLDLLIAVIDQDGPAVGQRDHCRSSSFSPEGVDSGIDPQKTVATISETRPSTTKAGNAVERVSCTGVTRRATLCGDHGEGGPAGAGVRGAVAVAAGTQTHRDLLQRACLRLFVTGMDLFFPSCAQRCSLLARYLSKYLR